MAISWSNSLAILPRCYVIAPTECLVLLVCHHSFTHHDSVNLIDWFDVENTWARGEIDADDLIGDANAFWNISSDVIEEATFGTSAPALPHSGESEALLESARMLSFVSSSIDSFVDSQVD